MQELNYINILNEIKNVLEDDSNRYFTILKSYLLCEISKSEFLEELNEICKKHSSIIELNNRFMIALCSKQTRVQHSKKRYYHSR
ncbi:Uncharacterized protein QTN25_006553 [Entamoeba marina]